MSGLGVARPRGQAGWNVAIVDCLPYGGTCALRGCDPKKMLVGVTEAIDWSQRMRSNGLFGGEMSSDWTKMMAFKRSFTDTMPKRIGKALGKMGVVQLNGIARFTSPGTVQVEGRELHAPNFHIATGARPVTLGIPGEDLLTTSTGFLELESMPSRVAFVGGGFISFEFAHVVFTLPPVARVGLLEAQARQQGFDFEVNFQKTGHWYSSLRIGEKYSAYKVLVEKGTGKILGAHLIGPGAEEQINLFTMTMGAGLSANQLKAVIFAYPSYASDLGSMV